MATAMSNPVQLKQAQKMMWSLGDYRAVATMLEPDAEAMARACGPLAGRRVLDVAAGNGNFAAAAAGTAWRDGDRLPFQPPDDHLGPRALRGPRA